MGRPPRTRVLAVVLVVAALVIGATACQPRPDARDRPVVFVHGYMPFGQGHDCQGKFGSLQSSLRAEGFGGELVTVEYYDSDRNCDVSLFDWGSIENSSSWKTLAKVFSHYLYETYTSKGIAVDLVGHSMGGLIVRGAVMGSSRGESGFSPPLLVEDAVTLGTPHEGAAWYSYGCLWGQCSELNPLADDIAWLARDANPQGAEGTEWTVLGSGDDEVVPASSALAMWVPAERRVRYSSLDHNGYLRDAGARDRVAAALAGPGR